MPLLRQPAEYKARQFRQTGCSALKRVAARPERPAGQLSGLAAGRRHAQEFSPVGPVVGLVRPHAVAVGDLPVDVGVKVGKGST